MSTFEDEVSKRTSVMGILNITPDSFADGGRYSDLHSAINRGQEMIDEGVAIIDIGGESTRPGAARISVEVERGRVMPALTELVKRGAVISIDTTRASIAREAIKVGALYINDVSGGLADKNMAEVVSQNPKIQYVVMHWRAHSHEMEKFAEYKDVVREVKDELSRRVDDLIASGVNTEQIIIDPGLGFSKTPEQNWEILRNVDRFALLGFPILIGASRKRFLGELTGSSNPDDREAASIALTTLLAKARIWGVRTHSVKPHIDAINAVEAMRNKKVLA